MIVLRKASGYKVNIQNPVAFLYTNNKLARIKVRKNMSFEIALKNNKIARNKPNGVDERPVQ